MSSTIHRKRKITTHNDDSDDNDGGDVDGGASADWGTAITLAGIRGPVVDLSWRYLPPLYSLGQICEKGIF